MSNNFQQQVNEWMQVCFGAALAKDKMERNHRFLEEALELVQSLGCTKSEAHQITEYVFNRQAGEACQECGGVMITLAAVSTAASLNMLTCGEEELERIWKYVEQIRIKQQNKPRHLPSASQNCRIAFRTNTINQ